MIESGEVKKYYQWRIGFRSGQVECYLAETEDTIFFESGTSVPKNRLDTDLVQINEEIYLQSSSTAQSQKALEEKWKEMLGNDDVPENKSEMIQEIKPQMIEKNPIQIILERQKKKESRSITIDLEIKIPNQKVIELLTTMFDEDEVFDEIVSTSVDLSDSDIRKLIHESIIKTLKTNNVE